MDTIEFHNITLEDQAWMTEKIREEDRNACEYTFANNFIWRNVYQVEVAVRHGCLVIRFRENDEYIFSYPVGKGDKRAVIEELLFWCEKEKRKFQMSPLSEADRQELTEWFPGQFLFEGSRENYDYIYSREKLATLAGKKLHGKRNHIARFKDGEDWSYEPMSEDNLEDCRSMTYTWMNLRAEKWNPEMEREVMVLHEAFDHFDQLGLVGGVLKKAGEIVAFCIGEPLNSDTFVVHFEKAFPDLQGAYPMINQQFVLHACEDYAYVNREEDTGDPGLRKAKLSYYPEILLKKYVACKSHVVYADRERDREQIMKIWQTCFGDEEEYISFYLEHRMTENNMMVIYEDGKAVSMVSFLPAQYKWNGMSWPVRYVYAVATLPEYRQRGYATEILQFAIERYGESLIVAPADENLCAFYERLGFRQAFEPKIMEYRKPDLTDCAVTGPVEMESVSPEEYLTIRDKKFEAECSRIKEGYVCWDVDAVRYAMEMNASCGGKTAAIILEEVAANREQAAEDEKEILMYAAAEDTLEIIETTLGWQQLCMILPQLFEETGTQMAKYHQMGGMLWPTEDLQEFMPGKNGYLNLTLD